MAERTGLEIAIVGLSGRFPQAQDIAEYWHNLCQGVEAITPFTEEELVANGVDPRLVQQPNYVKAASVLEDIDCFDASFFGYSPREAEIMDPQHRIFLETAWHALEHAGYAPEKYEGAIGVYAGAGLSNYLLRAFAHDPQSQFLALIGNDKDFLTTRVSYKLGLTGPSLDIQTACSTSLVAVHVACQGLLSGECDMALAGGVAIKVPQKAGYLYEEGGILSPNGHCRAFDAEAQGTVVGNGVGIVVLKRLEDAEADGDTIWAIIKGTAINNDGAAKIGYTAPSVEGQAAVIQAAQLMAEVEPDSISYVEAHGTGTPLGDPIEIAALTRVFGLDTADNQQCAIGSVKTNIGHLDAAAGISGLMKTVLALHHRTIPPSLNFETPNPKIGFEKTPFYVNTEAREWTNGQEPRRAAVSSFGIGGTNAHAVLEEAPSVPGSGASRSQQLVLLSANTAVALDDLTAKLAGHLRAQPELDLADIAYTLQVGRTTLPHRRAFVCQNRDEALNLLAAQAAGQTPAAVLTTAQEQKERPVIFLFPGQGAQYVGMGRDLYEAESVFREAVDECAHILQPYLGFDLRTVLYPEAGQDTTDRLRQTAVTQPALFVIEYALAQLWLSWGVQPQAMMGHSVGEYVAACLAGVFSLEDGLALIAARGQLMQQLPAGSMLSVPLPADALRSRLPEGVSLAAVNGPEMCVVSGPTPLTEAFAAALQADEIEVKQLHTSHAFHSTMMDPILEPFAQRMQQVDLQAPTIPYISNLTGTWVRPEEAINPDYWAQHLRQAVLFEPGLATLLADETPLLLEVGPGHTLSTLARRHPQKAPAQVAINALRHHRDEQDDVAFLLHCLQRLWLAGVHIDWAAFSASEQRRRVPLPLYPFARERYWLEDNLSLVNGSGGKHTAVSPQQNQGKQPFANWFYVPEWQPAPLTATAEAAVAETWLIFSNSQPLSEQLIAQLREAGQEVIAVEVGADFKQQENGRYTLNPEQPTQYDQLLAALDEAGQQAARVLHLWLADNSTRPFAEWQQRGFYSLVYLAQAWERCNGGEPLQIELVTSQLQDISGSEPLLPAKATALAPLRVLPQEYAAVRGRHIDITLPNTAVATERVCRQLQQELAAPLDQTAVAYRGQRRWVQQFVNLPDGSAETSLPLRDQGVYLFTSDLTPVTFVLADYLAQKVKANLVFLTANQAAPNRANLVEQLQAAGATVSFYEADVADAVKVNQVITAVCDRFGQLHGVLHTASATTPEAFTTIQETTETAVAQHFQPKIQGLEILQQAVAEMPLDFCLLHSSLAALLGGIRFLGQTAADLYLDAAANVLSRQLPGRWLSINWDAWDIAAEQSVGDASLALKAGDVTAALDHILRQAVSGQIAVSTHSLPARLESWREQAAVQTAVHERPAHILTPYVAPRNEMEETLVTIWETALGIHPVGVHDNFFELGGHSLLLTQIVARIREQFPVELPLSQLFAAQTVAELILVIVQGLAAEEEGDDLLALLNEIEGVSTPE